MDGIVQEATSTANETATPAPADADFSMADLEAMAKAADDGRDYTPKAKDNDQAATDQKDAPADAGKESQEEPEAKDNADKKQEAKPKESEFQKKQKERERFDRNWAEFQKEKEAFRAEKAKYDAEMAKMRQEMQELKKPKKADQDPELLDDLAKMYEEEGNERMASLARDKAKELRAQEAQQPKAEARASSENWKTPEFQTEWQKHTAGLIDADPSLNDPSNPIVKVTQELLHNKTWSRFFLSAPDGIKAAHEVARIMHAAGQAKALQGELDKAKAEISRLNKLTGISGSNPAGTPTPKDPNNVQSFDELRELAAAVDRGESV
jgi:DNA repair exonuclease SbcCD ATPase subunit